jgi:hypothetical protein
VYSKGIDDNHPQYVYLKPPFPKKKEKPDMENIPTFGGKVINFAMSDCTILELSIGKKNINDKRPHV